MGKHAPGAGAQGAGPALNPAALSVDQVSRVLSRMGGRQVTEQMVQQDVRDGAPSNPDGTINLVHYGAWLTRQPAKRDQAGPASPQAR